MNFELQRKIDYYLGIPCCFLLTGIHRISNWLFAEREETPPQKILIIKLVEQGATVVAYQSIQRAVEIVGRENVYLLVFSENAEIIQFLNVLSEANTLKIRNNRLFPFIIDTLRVLYQIRRLEIDTTVDFEFFSRATAILAFLTGAKRRIGLHRYHNEGSYRGDLLTHRLQYNSYIHTGFMYYLLIEASLQPHHDLPALKSMDFEPNLAPAQFQPCEKVIQRVKNRLNGFAGRMIENPIVLLNPNLKDMLPQRSWPSERFIELGQTILNAFPQATLVITGPPSERMPAAQFTQTIHPSRAINMAGRTSLEELFALYTIADLLVTSDSGPGHFSSLTSIETIVLFGPETPKLFGPCGEKAQIIWAGLACSPCINAFNQRRSPCMNNLCMQEISSDSVFQKVAECLQKKGSEKTG